MSYVNIIFSELLRKTLRKGSYRKLPSRKCARSCIASDSRRSTRKNERPFLSDLLVSDLVLLECEDSLSGEGKGTFDIDFSDTLDVLWCNVKEWFPDEMSRIKYCHANGVFGRRVFGPDRLPGRRQI
jgi:hypothetical protein